MRVCVRACANPGLAADSAKECQLCSIGFNLFVRRHHCRYCGNIFCHTCSEELRLILKFGYTQNVRVCGKCVVLVDRSEKLSNAVFSNEVTVVKGLLNDRAFKAHVMSYSTLYPPLFVAAKHSMLEMAQVILGAGAKINFKLPSSTAWAFNCPKCKMCTV